MDYDYIFDITMFKEKCAEIENVSIVMGFLYGDYVCFHIRITGSGRG